MRPALLLAMVVVSALPGVVSANPLPLPHPDSTSPGATDYGAQTVRCLVEVYTSPSENGEVQIDVLYRVPPGTEITVYLPSETGDVLTAVTVPADEVYSMDRLPDTPEAWPDAKPVDVNGAQEKILPGVDRIELPYGLLTDYDHLSNTLKQVLAPYRDDVKFRTLTVKAENDETAVFVRLILKAVKVGNGCLVAVPVSGSVEVPYPAALLYRDGDRWVLKSVAGGSVSAPDGPAVLLLYIPTGGTEELPVFENHRFPKLDGSKPYHVVVRYFDGRTAVVDMITRGSTVYLPKGARVVKCGYVPANAYDDGYKGTHVNGFTPVENVPEPTTVDEAPARDVLYLRKIGVPYLVWADLHGNVLGAKLSHLELRVDHPKDTLLVVRFVATFDDGVLRLPVEGDGEVLGLSTLSHAYVWDYSGHRYVSSESPVGPKVYWVMATPTPYQSPYVPLPIIDIIRTLIREISAASAPTERAVRAAAF